MDLLNESKTEPISNPKGHPMIRLVAIPNNHASPSSLFIPLIRLQKPAVAVCNDA